MRVLGALLLVAACSGAPDGAIVTRCSPWGIGHVEVEYNTDCSSVQYAFDAAQRGAEPVLDPNSFRWIVENTVVRIHAEDSWMSPWPTNEEVSGFFTWGRVDLARGGCPLVHELLHAWQTYHLDPTTSKHYQWAEKGYWSADLNYRYNCPAM